MVTEEILPLNFELLRQMQQTAKSIPETMEAMDTTITAIFVFRQFVSL